MDGYHYPLSARRAFVSACEAHLAGLDAGQYEYFRAVARRGPWMLGPTEAPELAETISRSELVDRAASESGLRLSDLSSLGEAQEVGCVDGRPVLFFAAAGLYAWARSENEPFILDAALSFPAYPPGW